jgi:hypothetical protein
MRKKFTGGMPSLPKPDMERCRRNGELERRLKHAGGHKGEISVSLMWDSADHFDLVVVPPGGRRGELEICFKSRKLFGGHLDVCRGCDSGRALGAELMPLENVYWPTFLGNGKVQKPPPPSGHYRIYMHVHDKRVTADVEWVCRVQVGRDSRWFGGVIPPSEAGAQVDIFSFHYDGPEDSSTKLQEHLVATQYRQPCWKVGTEHGRAETCSNEAHAITDKISTPMDVGPASYSHATSFVSQY